MAEKKNQFFRRNSASGYGDGHHPIPAAGEDRYESIYRNPVGAQSGYDLEGQREGTAVPMKRCIRRGCRIPGRSCIWIRWPALS